MGKQLLSIFIMLWFPLLCFSQGEIIKEKDLNFYNENSMGLKLSSNGFGLDYRFGYRYTNKTRGFFESEINYLRNPKEIRLYNPYSISRKKFVYGKVNTVFNVKLGTGIQREIFSKQDYNSISIRYQIAGGLALAFEKPIYYEIADSTKTINNQQIIYTSPQTINVDYHQPIDVMSRKPFFMGISETKITPGVYVRLALNFEFSNHKYRTRAIEIGSEFDLFPREITIMAKNGQNLFLNIYLSYRFGYKHSTLISRDARKFLKKEQKRKERTKF